MKIPISMAKQIRKDLGATHIVIFTIDPDGTQNVATHGKTKQNSDEAAVAGNKLKASLGWPDNLCHDKPIERIHANCDFYEPDYGTFCVNGWSQDGSKGWCCIEPRKTRQIGKERACQFFEPNSSF